ncbi:hypothetical protein HYU14_00980 [Candidatus Woesearchaeota archaeon]|nr:hypothetical protein [Candidatus Woesearchaeota archaeon]
MAAAKTPWLEYGEGPLYIRKAGVWDMQDLYESMADFLRMRKYKLHEKIYKHKRPSPFGAERQYVWEASREETEYYEFHYLIYFHTYDARDIDVVDAQGNKKNFTKGRIWVELQADLRTDWEKQWGSSKFWGELKSFFNKYIIKNNIVMAVETKLKYELYELHAMIKQRLQMESDEFEHLHLSGMHRKY